MTITEKDMELIVNTFRNHLKELDGRIGVVVVAYDNNSIAVLAPDGTDTLDVLRAAVDFEITKDPGEEKRLEQPS